MLLQFIPSGMPSYAAELGVVQNTEPRMVKNKERYYAIKSIEEARQYLNHPVLGTRLL